MDTVNFLQKGYKKTLQYKENRTSRKFRPIDGSNARINRKVRILCVAELQLRWMNCRKLDAAVRKPSKVP